MGLITVGRQLTAATDAVTAEQNPASLPYRTLQLGQLVPLEYDDIELGYTTGDLTSVVYRNGGPIVATLTLTWVTGDLVRGGRA